MESDLPYDGDFQTALEKGDNNAIEKITEWRRNTDIIFNLPKMINTQQRCEVEIVFLDEQGQPEDNFCGKKRKLEDDITSSNTYFIINIALKKILGTWYILEEDLQLISKSKKNYWYTSV